MKVFGGNRGRTVLIASLVVILVAAVPVRVRSAVPVAVIVNSEVDVDTLGVDELQRIYLGKRSRWPDDTRVKPALIKSGDLHESFVQEVLERSLAKFNSYWKQLVFTGKGVPPKSFVGEDELVEYVRDTPGAVGYVSASSRPDGVRTIILD